MHPWRKGIRTALRTQVLRVRIPPGVRPYDGTEYILVSGTRFSGFESRYGYAGVSQMEEGRSSNLRYVWIRIPPPVFIYSPDVTVA